jgi:hypothetical protein
LKILETEKIMKFLSLSLLLILILFSFTEAKAPFTEVKLGYLDPEDAKPGLLWGINLGRMIDESISWSFEFNYYQKTYSKITTVDDIQLPSGITPSVQQKELEYKTYMIPLFLKLNWERQLGQGSPLYLRASGGLGWEMVWNKEENYETAEKSTRFYNGFGWQATAGLGIQISSSANLFADGFYNGSKVSRNSSTSEEGFPTWEELDISGFGVRAGVSIVGFGW